MRVIFVGRDRRAWKVLALHLLTFGVYRRVWLHRATKEVDGHEALGVNHRWNVVLLCLPVLGPTWVQAQLARRVRPMLKGSAVRFGPWPVVYFPSWVPLLGNLWFLSWTQSRLNRFWAEQRRHPERGVDLDIGLEKDPVFLVELQKALVASLHAGSRFDRGREEREEVQAERLAARQAGGSTPLRWWRRPERPPLRLLKVTCGRCQTPFAVRQDPLADTPLVCWKCGLTEILPRLGANPLARPVPAAVPTVQATCAGCQTAFHAVRSLTGPTALACPSCGRTETLPAPAETATARGARRGRSARR